MRREQIPYQLFADDNQLLNSVRCGDNPGCAAMVANTEGGISEIQKWLTQNWLALNAPKTDMINIVSTRRSGSIAGITIDVVWIPNSDCVKDLGVWLDGGMDLQTQMKKVCSAAYASLHKIGRIRAFLDKSSTERLVNAFVTSRLDFNNGILFGLPDKSLEPLQRVQNMAARMVCRRKKFDRITPILQELHWLPVKLRIKYKLLSVVHKSLNGVGPSYLADLLCEVQGRTRAASSRDLVVKRTRSRYGDRSFSSCGPCLWNSLPHHLRTLAEEDFKRELKTFLFEQYFGEVAP